MDSDGYDRTVEEHVGTSPQTPCGNAGWPAELDPTGLSANDLDLQDLTSFLAPVRYLDSNIGDIPGNIRWDLVPGTGGILPKDINLQDLTQILLVYAPMHEGVRSFNGPPCPWP
jgi:hypothetical protein